VSGDAERELTSTERFKRLLGPLRPVLRSIRRRLRRRKPPPPPPVEPPYVIRDVSPVDVAGDMTGDELEQRLLFRFGFILMRPEEESRARRLREFLPTWTSRTLFGWLLVHHPETRIATYGDDDAGVIVLGEAFDVAPDGPGVAALCATLLQATGDEFWRAFDQLSGRFALVAVTSDGTRVMHDPFGGRSLFYRTAGSPAVASHSELLALAFEHPNDQLVRELRGLPEYRARGVTYLPGDWTVFSGVYGLAPNNCFDLMRGTTARYWPRQPRGETSLDDFLSHLERYLAAFVPHVGLHHTPVLGLSGGVDSRALIAAFRTHGSSMKLVTWTGNYVTEAELPVVEELRAYLDTDHRYVNVAEHLDDPTFLAVKAISDRNVGRYRGGPRLTGHMYRTFHDVPDAAFVRGYGGEILRGFYDVSVRTPPADAPDTPPVVRINAAELFRRYNGKAKIAPRERWTEIGQLAFEQFLERAHYDSTVADSGYEFADIFYWEHRMGMWGSVMHSEMDAAMWSVTGYNSRPLYESAFGLERGLTLKGSLLAEATARLDPELAAFALSG
jgi:hypothetical protein